MLRYIKGLFGHRNQSGPKTRRSRRLRAESLETRKLLAANVMHNDIIPEDVNNDGVVSAIDALTAINSMNRTNARDGDAFTDVNNDGRNSARGALQVINRIGRERLPRNRPGGPGDAPPEQPLDQPSVQPSEQPIEDPASNVSTEVRSIDGTGNNLDDPTLGSADTELLRLTTTEYADGISEPSGEDRPSAREVSNTVAAQTTTETNDRFLTDITWLWGQFIDHDIDLMENADPAESFDIEVPEGDIFFDPDATGEQVIGLNRSTYDDESGTSTDDPREQINQITAFIDGSVIYGSDEERAAELRTFENGLLATSEGNLLPFNEAGLANAGGPSDSLFLAGDVRANENAALTAMQTLWVREHNYWATELAAEDPALTDEQLYQEAKAIVTGELQAITYNEFLPALLGEGAIRDYEGYDSTVDPSISNVFSTAIYRFGHSMLSSELLRLEDDGSTADEGNLSLQSAFFAPSEIIENDIDSILLGATAQVANEIDNQIVDDVRNFLFGEPGDGGFDLASLNIQRGRDHGLADYNQTREDVGLDRVTDFSEITTDPELAAKLEQLYGDVDNIDVWVGALAEDRLAGSSVGELVSTVIADQFERIRDGDRFWYGNTFSGEELAQIDNTSLSDVIERNTEITGLRENVFFDSSVLRVELADQGGPSDVVVAVDDSRVDVINARSGQVLESRGVDEVSQIQIVGSDRAGDGITVDLSAATVPVPGGIVVNAGADAGNSVDLIGSNGANSVIVDGNQVSVNGTTIVYSNVDSIRWHGSGAADDLATIEAGEAQFVVVDDAIPGEMNQRPGNGQNRRGGGDQMTAPTTTPVPKRSLRSMPVENGNGPRTGPVESLAGMPEILSRTAAVDAALADLGNLAATQPQDPQLFTRPSQQRRRG